MKKVGFLAIGILALTFVGCSSNKETVNEESEALVSSDKEAINDVSDILVIGLDENFPPMAFNDENGNLTGFDIELAKAFSEESGVEIALQPIDWSAKELELSTGKIDVIWNGLTITEERKEKMLFTDPYLANSQIIIVNGDSDINSKADLAGKNVGAQRGSSAVDAIKSEEGALESFKELSEYSDNVTAFLDLEIGRVDAIVADEIAARYYISQNNQDFRVLEDNFGEEEYGISTRLDDTQTNKLINDTMKILNENGKSAEISEKWFGEDIILK